METGTWTREAKKRRLGITRRKTQRRKPRVNLRQQQGGKGKVGLVLGGGGFQLSPKVMLERHKGKR